MIRSYHREYTSSRPITEVKHGWAPPVPGTEMAQEAGVPNRFACKHILFALFLSIFHHFIATWVILQQYQRFGG